MELVKVASELIPKQPSGRPAASFIFYLNKQNKFSYHLFF